MPKGRYLGLIKDYDGGTMMECYVHPSVDFARVPEMLRYQRAFLEDRLRRISRSHVVYPPLRDAATYLAGASRGQEAAARLLQIPGVKEANWTLADLVASLGANRDADRARTSLRTELLQVVRKIEDQNFAWPFRQPVDTSEVPDYLEIIKDPIDLFTIDKRIRKGEFYKNREMLRTDLVRMALNCKEYNDPNSTYYECAVNLEKYLATVFT
uniref:Bromo domain-containing protein n=2 Tax=Corethron hystrix TaxID=216773 RepID=A0A7S1B7E7_9STRA|mmetsp:Transcript_15950/g.35913  ORF Transcript_15950/g.35913 Transcript_15950/m.35913 type:complete len:212 (+) Transcript_15950:477-1112(+)